MKASINLLTKQRVTSKGYPIVVKLFYNSQNKPSKNIGHSFEEDWDFQEKKTRVTHPEHFELLPKILNYHAKIIKINNNNYSFDDARSLLFGPIVQKSNNNTKFISFFDVFIKELKAKNKSTRMHEQVRNILYNYLDGKDIEINDVTYEWLNKFMIDKIKPGTNGSGVMTYLSKMRTVFKEAQRRESLKVKSINPFSGLIETVPRKKDVIDIEPEELKKLFNYQPKKGTSKKNNLVTQRNIELLLLQFYLGGIDYADLALLEWSKMKNKRIKFKRYKNRSKKSYYVTADNMITPEALAIIEKYGTKDSDRIFSFIPNPFPEGNDDYPNNRRTFNKSIAKVCENLKIPKMSSKSMRYVFRTFAGNLFIHDLIVMNLQAHKSESVSHRYQGKIPNDIKDKEHQKIIDLLLY